MAEQTQLHGTCVLLDDIGVLLRGASGSGKSDLALRLIDGGALLVADDRVDITRDQDNLWAKPPETLAGKLEVRGIGIVAMPFYPKAPIRLIVDLVADRAVDRLPLDLSVSVLDIAVPCLRLDPFTASAPAKIRTRVAALLEHRLKILDPSRL